MAEQCATWTKAYSEEERVFVNFRQVGTVTGRFSASNPPFQQMKKSGVRRIASSAPGYMLVDFDFQVIEVVVAAVIYNEPALLEIVLSGRDIYIAVAAQVLGVDESEINKEDPRRKFGKILVLSLNYCKGVNTFIEDCRLEGVIYSDKELKQMFDRYFELFPGIRRYQLCQGLRAAVGQEARSIWGRRSVMGPNHEWWQMRNKLVNHPVQMTVSDLLKAVMVQLYAVVRRLGGHIVGSVHDEVIYEVPESAVAELEAACEVICTEVGAEMLGKDIPVRIEVAHGRSWWDCCGPKEGSVGIANDGDNDADNDDDDDDDKDPDHDNLDSDNDNE